MSVNLRLPPQFDGTSGQPFAKLKSYLYQLINELNFALNDLEVTEGKSGNWTFRKWNSGIAECWGSFYTPPVKDFTYIPIGGMWYWRMDNKYGDGNNEIDYPVGLFKSAPAVTAITQGFQGCYPSLLVNSKSQVSFFLYFATNWNNADIPIEINIHAIGRWK